MVKAKKKKTETQSHVERIGGRFEDFQKNGRGYKAICPAHDDSVPSLSISEGNNGGVVLHCHAGCDTRFILATMGLTLADLMPGNNGRPVMTKTYDYRDEKGKLLYQSCRYEPKAFKQRRPNGKGGWIWSVKDADKVLYDLRRLLKNPDHNVFIPEGAKDCDRLKEAKLIATTNIGGAKSPWLPEYTETLKGRRVVLIPDNDDPGRERVGRIARELLGVAKSVKILELPGLPDKGDVCDWFDNGGTREKLMRLVKKTEEFDPGSQPVLDDSGELQTRRYDTIERKDVRWLWNQRFAIGKLNMLHGDPDLGKTWLTLYVISRVTTGRPFCDGAECELGEALFVTAEDDPEDTIGPRLDRLGADSHRVHDIVVVVVKGEERHLALDTNIPALDRWLAVHPDVSVVVVDPAAAFLGKVNANSNSEVREVLTKLAKVAERHSVAFLMIDHLSKSHEKAKLGGIGSVAWTAGPRCTWQLRADPDDPGRRLFLKGKVNIATEPVKGLAFRLDSKAPEVVVWEKGEVKLTIDDVAGASSEDTPRVEAKAWLTEQLKKGPVPSKQLEEQAKKDGMCWRTVRYAKKEMGVVSKMHNKSWSTMTKEQAEQFEKETKKVAGGLKKKRSRR